MQITTLEDVAIIIQPATDNVAVATVDFLERGTRLKHADKAVIIQGGVLRGQSFSVKRLRKGEAYISLGDPFGMASQDVEPGDPIDDRNLERERPR